MKDILLLGHGISNDGLKKFLENFNQDFDYLELNEIEDDYKFIVKSPGIPLDLINIRGEIISDIELIYRIIPKNIIAISGTNGKTTITMLINHFLDNSVACGNIGYPFGLAMLEEYDFYVCELSSFMLEGCKYFKPKIAILSNLWPHHLDHHKSLKKYIEAKEMICINQDENDFLIYDYDSPYLKDIVKKSKGQKYSFSTRSMLANCYLNNNYIYFNNKALINLKRLKINFEYDIKNIMTLCLTLIILKKSFKGFYNKYRKFIKADFRTQYIRRDIINDAKSTNPYSTIAALKNLNKVILICGGYDRGEQLNCLLPYLDRISLVICYGESKDKLFKFFDEFNTLAYKCFDLKEAVSLCVKYKKKENTILYSPMFASYDQYKSYIERGNEFNQLIFHLYKRSRYS